MSQDKRQYRYVKQWVAGCVLAAAIPFAGSIGQAARAAEPDGAGSWARFRGPNGSGVCADAFDAPITEQNIAWKIELPGVGHSSPAIWGDRLYVTSGEKTTAKRTVMCLSATDGKMIWQRDFNSYTFPQHNDNCYASATPAVDDAGVYVCWTTPKEYTLLAMDHDGKDLWKQSLGEFTSLWGSGASPIIVGDMVILANDQEGPKSSVAAFDHKTGKQRWTVSRDSSNKTSSSTPCLFSPKDGPPQLILTSKACGITSVDPQNGSTNWSMADAFSARTIGSPVVANDLVIGTCGEGANDRQLIAIHPGHSLAEAPKVAYKLAKFPPYVPTPLVKGDLLFLWGDSGLVSCLKAATGEKVWSEKVGGQYYGSPICAGSTLWCLSRKGELVGVAASDTYRLVGRLDLGEPTQATPAVANGKMYLRTASHLICVSRSH